MQKSGNSFVGCHGIWYSGFVQGPSVKAAPKFDCQVTVIEDLSGANITS